MDLFGCAAATAAPLLAAAVLDIWPDVDSVADFGCGTGHYVHAFIQRDVEAVGYERSKYARAYAHEKLGLTLHTFDLESEHLLFPTCDLALSLEVAEHLPARLGHVLVQVLTKTAPRVVFSAAQPGQGGNGHINEQSLDYWQNMFEGRRYHLRQEPTEFLRARLRDATLAPWLSRNVMVFCSEAAG